MLNAPLKRTWADLANIATDEIDLEVLKNIWGVHDSRLRFIAAPASPMNAEGLTSAGLNTAVSTLRHHYKYIVADLPHDFSEVALDVLDAADVILLMVAPEIASIRTAAIALDTYQKLGYDSEKVKLVLNWTFEHGGLAPKKIEAALKYPISLTLPFAPAQFVSAINRGQPLLYNRPDDPISALIEDFSFRLSKEAHQSLPPANPSASWQRVNERLNLFNNKRKKSSFLSF
jgi:pilus assembly protein CpaE